MTALAGALAVALSAAAAWIWYRSHSTLRRVQPDKVKRRATNALTIAIAVIGITGLFMMYAVAGASPTILLLCVVVSGGSIALVVRGQRRRQGAARRRDQVSEACMVLAQALRTGRMPGEALELAADDCPVLHPVVAVQRLGGDPVASLFRLSTAPGAAGLGDLARAWALIIGSGAPAGPLLERIAQNARHTREVDHAVRTELAAPRMTGRLLALLPAAGLVIGFGLGGNPLDFLVGTVPGQLCLLLGLLLAGSGVLWSERIAGLREPAVDLPQRYRS